MDITPVYHSDTNNGPLDKTINASNTLVKQLNDKIKTISYFKNKPNIKLQYTPVYLCSQIRSNNESKYLTDDCLCNLDDAIQHCNGIQHRLGEQDMTVVPVSMQYYRQQHNKYIMHRTLMLVTKNQLYVMDNGVIKKKISLCTKWN